MEKHKRAHTEGQACLLAEFSGCSLGSPPSVTARRRYTYASCVRPSGFPVPSDGLGERHCPSSVAFAEGVLSVASSSNRCISITSGLPELVGFLLLLFGLRASSVLLLLESAEIQKRPHIWLRRGGHPVMVPSPLLWNALSCIPRRASAPAAVPARSPPRRSPPVPPFAGAGSAVSLGEQAARRWDT